MLSKNNIIEFIIVLSSIIGSFFVANIETEKQIIGFCSFLLANVFGIIYFKIREMNIMVVQNIIFLILSLEGICVRVL
jgi:uncharacterized membrane protein YhhN